MTSRSGLQQSSGERSSIEMSNPDAIQKPSEGSTSGQTEGLLSDVSTPQTSLTGSSLPATTLPAEMEGRKQSTPQHSSNAEDSTTGTSHDPVLSSSNENTTASAPAQQSSSAPPMTRLDSVAIGPSTDENATPIINETAGPVVVITLLLTSGARHPYKIDEKYLTKRNVTVPGEAESGKKDPFSISVYTLKELILREWREEWEAQPSSPSSIRLIFFGRLLEDNTALKDCRFNADAANVVHMTVRPQDIVDEEDAAKGATGREREGHESTAGCRCVIL